jgi:hypothetical protein
MKRPSANELSPPNGSRRKTNPAAPTSFLRCMADLVVIEVDSDGLWKGLVPDYLVVLAGGLFEALAVDDGNVAPDVLISREFIAGRF